MPYNLMLRGSPHLQGTPKMGIVSTSTSSVTTGDEDYIQNLFLLGKNKFWMDDESLVFSGNIFNVLTINAISENQANRYMLQEKDLGLGNQDS